MGLLSTQTRSGEFDGWTPKLREDMQAFNALNLAAALPKLPPGFKRETARKSHQRSLASVDELQKAEFPGRRSNDSKLEPPEVNSDSSSSVASSDVALRLVQSVCQCDSSENEPPEDVPTCGSLTLESDDGDESVGSSSVAESVIGRRVGAL